MRLPWSVSCMRAGICVPMCVCASVSETEISEWVYVCVCVWEAVIWCMGVGVKADRMKIVVMLVPST